MKVQVRVVRPQYTNCTCLVTANTGGTSSHQLSSDRQAVHISNWLTCVASGMIMRTHILACFLLSSAKSDLLDSKYSEIRHYDYNQWRPVYRGKEASYDANFDNNGVKESIIVSTERNTVRRIDDDKDRLFISATSKQSLVENVRQFIFQKVDNYATNFVNFGERLLGPEAELSYDLENKTIKAYGIDFNILYALDQLFLILTEFWAYVTTDMIFRIMWPE